MTVSSLRITRLSRPWEPERESVFVFQVRVSGDKQIVKYLFVQKNPQKCSENCMINILNSLKHSGTKTVPLVSGEWKHSHRSTMSPPKALNSKTTSDRVETRRRKKNTQWHVCPSLQHTHTHTLDPQHQDVHHRKKKHTQPTVFWKCFQSDNESEQSWTKSTEKQETETAVMKQCGQNRISYTDCVRRKSDMKWDEWQSECGSSDRCSIQACCRQLVGVQNYQHASVKFSFPI